MMAPASASAPASSAEGAPQWRLFLRALVDEIDSMAIPSERDDMLRGVGSRMARLIPLPEVGTLGMLQLEINDALRSLGWGQTALWLNEADRMLMIAHTGMPRIGSAGDPPGSWLGALLEGLYETWLARQPGGDSTLLARRVDFVADVLTIRYGRQ